MTAKVGIIGYPVGHSVSPAFQQAAFRFVGLDIQYVRWETPPEKLSERVTVLLEPEVWGANITVPHKQAIMSMLDDVDPSAITIGAVNTIVKRDGSLLGYNTDAAGFSRGLQEDSGMDPAGTRVLILGSGGSARAVAFALTSQGVADLTIASRTRSRARELAAELPFQRADMVSTLPWDERELVSTSRYDLIVNCTPYGMRGSLLEGLMPPVSSLLEPGVLVYDLVYNPQETPLLIAAKNQGADTVGGLSMLVYQGAMSFELWTGMKAPVDVMMLAAREQLLK